MGKDKTRKFRGSANHGRGKKAGRGAGLRGGRGNAGLHKHHYATTVIWKNMGYTHFGRHGFTRHPQPDANAVTNVGRLDEHWPGVAEINLEAAGIDKLLGAGSIGRAVTVTVPQASPSAKSKIEAAGGKLVLTGPAPEPAKPAAPAKGAKPDAGKGRPEPAKEAKAPKPAKEGKQSKPAETKDGKPAKDAHHAKDAKEGKPAKDAKSSGDAKSGKPGKGKDK